MRSYLHERFQQQASFLRRQFLQDGDLPFTEVLSEGVVEQAMTAINVIWLDRIYSPLVTLWVCLGQALSADSSCRAAVARLIAHRLSRGQRACSAETGAYCQARKRLPEEFFAETARRTGRALQAKVDPEWLWKGRRVYAYDGATVTMPDTPENQAAYPQPVIQRPGLGFPMARLAAVFSLACGAVVDLGISRYAGKGQSELGMLQERPMLAGAGIGRSLSGTISNYERCYPAFESVCCSFRSLTSRRRARPSGSVKPRSSCHAATRAWTTSRRQPISHSRARHVEVNCE